MTAVRALAAVTGLLVALVVQVTLLARVPLPGGPPDLVLIVVVALALAHGPIAGTGAGFAGGLLLDLVGTSAAGQLALVLCLVGCGAGLVREDVNRSTLGPVLVVAVAALAATLLSAGLGLLLGDPRVTGTVLGRRLPAAVLYDALLAPFLLPVVAAAGRRLGAAA